MDLDKAAAVIRPRRPWEGVDLGFALGRHWFWRLWGLWWLTALPVSVVSLWLFRDRPIVAILVIWWFKPVYEPLPMYWLSRALFGDRTPIRDLLPRLHRVLRPRLLPNLLWRRLSPQRSFYMPVALLEGLRGSERWERLRVLHGSQGAGGWLTFLGANMEGILALSISILIALLIPEELFDRIWNGFLADGSSGEPWLNIACYLPAMSILAPFYVAGGFALYLSRRTELEAWDLELIFRRLPEAPKPAFQVRGAVVVALLATGLCLLPGQEPSAASLTPGTARTTIEKVLDDEAFGGTRTEYYWQYIGEKDTTKDDPGWLEALFKLLLNDSPLLGKVLEGLMWLALAAGLIWLALYLVRHGEWFRDLLPGRSSEPLRPGKRSELFGLSVDEASLPDDVAGEARRLVDEGRVRAALGLLYRASLARLLHRHQLEVPDGATEGECLALVEASRPPTEGRFFLQLTRSWLTLAYGHRMPPGEQVRALCEQWRTVYGATTHDT